MQQLQDSMTEIKRCMSSIQPKHQLVDNGVSTQTEISAVHTPAGEENVFPYHRANRPQSLAIHQTIQEGNENKSFATNLVDSVLKKVSHSTDTTDDEVNTDILNSNDNPDVSNCHENPDMFTSCDEIIDSLSKNDEGLDIEFNNMIENVINCVEGTGEMESDYKDIIEDNSMEKDECEEVLCKELLQSMIENEKITKCNGDGKGVQKFSKEFKAENVEIN